MAGVDMIKSCQKALYQISDLVVDAILYLDAGSVEAFQFVGGLPLLLELGARAICSLEHASSLDVKAHSAYVDAPLGPDAFREYKTLLLQDYQELILKSELTQRSVKTNAFDKSVQTTQALQDGVVVEEEDWLQLASNENSVTGLEANSPGKDLDSDSPTITEEEERKNLTVSVNHFPMILCPLSPKVFVLASEGAVAEACISEKSDNSLSPGLPPVAMGLGSDGEDIPPGATLIAHFLHHLAGQIREAREAQSTSGGADVDLLLGGTTILTPNDMFDLYFCLGMSAKSATVEVFLLMFLKRALCFLPVECYFFPWILVGYTFEILLPMSKSDIWESHHSTLSKSVQSKKKMSMDFILILNAMGIALILNALNVFKIRQVAIICHE